MLQAGPSQLVLGAFYATLLRDGFASVHAASWPPLDPPPGEAFHKRLGRLMAFAFAHMMTGFRGISLEQVRGRMSHGASESQSESESN